MASFWSLCFLLVITSLTISPSPSLSLPSNLISTISTAPAVLPETPLSSPTQNLSPDITPLFPSQKGMSPSPTGEDSSMPTIPSTPSPPNPDEMVSYGPDVANPPFASMPAATSSASLHQVGIVSFVVFVAAFL